MTEELLDELERQRAELYARLAGTGDFRPGSVNETWRRCGKPNCACAQPGRRGHGPRCLWTRSAGGGTRTRRLAAAELGKVRRELRTTGSSFGDRADRAGERGDLRGQASPPAAGDGDGSAPPRGREEGGCARRSPRRRPRGRRAGREAARALGCDSGLEAAEAVIRAGC